MQKGMRLLNQYEVLRPLGRGAMGEVWLARDARLGRLVALKRLKPPLATLPGFRDRFLAEARAAARLDHPGVLDVYALDAAGPTLTLITEYVRGGSLASVPRRRWPVAAVLALGGEVARALQHVHERGLVHRDVKPANILLRRRGDEVQPVLGDFGLACDREAARRLRDGQIGTLRYMAPEQCLGRGLDGRADLYALGVVLFELLTGRLPHPIDTAADALQAHARGVVTHPRTFRADVPDEVAAIVLRLLRRDPAARYASGAALAAALDGVGAAHRNRPVAPPLFGRFRMRAVVQAA